MQKRNRHSLVLVLAAAAAMALAGCSGTTPSGDTSDGERQSVATENAEAALAQQYDAVVAVEGGYVVLSAPKNGVREVAYFQKQGESLVAVGSQTVGDPDGEGSLTVDGDMVVVQTTKNSAPQYAGFQITGSGLEPVDYYAAIAPTPAVQQGPFLLVNKHLNVLWYYEDGSLVKAYRVATGRQTEGPAATWQDYQTNFFTPEGTFQVTNFVMNPPYNALKPGDKSFAGGASGNPLGTRWMGFSVLEGDGAGIWGIHGTSEPEAIGTWASDGCIRMKTEQAEELFQQVSGRNPTLQIVGR